MLHFAHVPDGLHSLEVAFQHSSSAIDWFPIIFYPSVLCIAGLLAMSCWYLETRYIASRQPLMRSVRSSFTGEEREWTMFLNTAKPDKVELPKNVWSLIVASNLKQAKFNRRLGTVSISIDVGVMFSICIALVVVALQFLILFAMVLDLDPNAHVVISKSSRPWLDSAWTVNFIRWFMMGFICVGQIEEAHQSMEVIKAALVVESTRTRVHHSAILMMGFIQYCVMLWTVFTGLSIVLNFGTVADTVYSSMAIGFVSNLDDLAFQVLVLIFGCDADLNIYFCESALQSARDDSSDQESDKKDKTDAFHFLPAWLEVVFNFMVAFPLIWGCYIALRAWHTNTLPSSRFFDWFHQARLV